MPIATLDILQFRNLSKVHLDCAPGLNLIIGENASGKTSLLEAIYFLSRARSFRTRYPQRLIQHEQSFFRLVATLHSPPEQPPGRLGVERRPRELLARVDGEAVSNLSVLARRLPLLLLTPDSHRLLEDGPRQRRRFLDWGCFHREAGFLSAWQRYRGALRQRNAALRANARSREIAVWDRELLQTASALDNFRTGFCGALETILGPILEALLAIKSIQVVYQQGWSAGQSLERLLSEGLEQDRRQGHTRYGPHRASFRLEVAGENLETRLSRGQQKLLVIALILAQAKLYGEQHREPCILLIDDLPAELDSTHRQRVMQLLAQLPLQLFITAIEGQALSLEDWPGGCGFRLNAGSLEMV